MKYATLALVIACLCLVADARPVKAQSVTSTPTSGQFPLPDNRLYIIPEGKWTVTGFGQNGVSVDWEIGTIVGINFVPFNPPVKGTTVATGTGTNKPWAGPYFTPVTAGTT